MVIEKGINVIIILHCGNWILCFLIPLVIAVSPLVESVVLKQISSNLR